MAKNYRKTRVNRKANRKNRTRRNRSNRLSRRNNMNVMLGGFQEEKMMQEYKSPFVTNMVKY